SKLPNKIKVFAWRVRLNALPTSVKLAKRIQELQVGCPFCQFGEEDVLHDLVYCPFACQVWSLSPLPTRLIFTVAWEARSWMQQISSHLEEKEFGLFLCLYYPSGGAGIVNRWRVFC
ncbi:UNVERIFIED_CONTAM: hypothetical protein Slati_4465900, partial [Sesamum latifolium]